MYNDYNRLMSSYCKGTYFFENIKMIVMKF